MLRCRDTITVLYPAPVVHISTVHISTEQYPVDVEEQRQARRAVAGGAGAAGLHVRGGLQRVRRRGEGLRPDARGARVAAGEARQARLRAGRRR